MNVELLYQELVEWYDKPLPSIEHEPIQFEYIVKLFMYFRNKE